MTFRLTNNVEIRVVYFLCFDMFIWHLHWRLSYVFSPRFTIPVCQPICFTWAHYSECKDTKKFILGLEIVCEIYLFVIWLYFAWLDARCPCAPAAKLQTMLLHLDQSHVSSSAWHRVIFLAAQSSQTMSIHFVFGLLLVHLLCVFPCSIIWGSLMLLIRVIL